MMARKIPEEAQKYVDFLSSYDWDEDLEEFNILHLYPGKAAVIDNVGYVDSRLFDLVGYHTGSKRRRRLGRHDGLSFGRRIGERSSVALNMIRIFVDGSTLIKFDSPVRVEDWSQDAKVYSF